MGLVNPDLTGQMYDGDLKPIVEIILRELNGKMSTDNIDQISADKVQTGRLESSSGQTYFDLDNNQIIMNDGSNDRLFIGDDGA